ncbi:MAG: cytidylate kinase family protein [Candidatus Bilamarchaeaceae archaeon]
MIIAVWGFTGSGKNTLGELLAKSLGYPVISPTFKDIAAKEGISLMEFQKKAELDHNIDKKFDELLKEQVAATKGNCVVTTWLGPWMVKADLRIKINVPLDVRAARVAKRDNISLEEARKHVEERDRQNIERYRKVYGIDITDDSIFDLQLDGEKNSPEELLRQVLYFIKKREK